MKKAKEVFEEALAGLEKAYGRSTFYCERDVVWTIQGRLVQMIEKQDLPYRVYSDYPILPGKKRSFSADIAILDSAKKVLLVVEFKYEPSHNRQDILQEKLPVVEWGKNGVEKDVNRVKQFVQEGKCQSAVSIFIDEGRWRRKKEPYQGSKWYDWPMGVSILKAEFGS